MPTNEPDNALHHAEFRFYAALNDFLKPPQRGLSIDYQFRDYPGIKDPIEALGVPHTEVELIVVNGESVDFNYQLRGGDRVAVYPPFLRVDISPLTPLREPLAEPAFVLDVHLGKLARLLRLLGMDVLYDNGYRDAELVDISEREGRVLLTRDRRLLFHRRVVYGHFVCHTDPMTQAKEVVNLYRLENRIRPFTRCVMCNGNIAAVDKDEVRHRLEPKTARYYDKFYRCDQCGRVYWAGSHLAGLNGMLREFT